MNTITENHPAPQLREYQTHGRQLRGYQGYQGEYVRQLREYQTEHVSRLCSELINNNNKAANVCCVGGGKTTVARIVLNELRNVGISDVTKVIVATPFIAIGQGFVSANDESWNVKSDNATHSPYLIGSNAFSQLTHKNSQTLLRYLNGHRTSDIKVVTHQLMASRAIKEYFEEIETCVGILLCVDEAHRCYATEGEDNDKHGTILGEVASIIHAKGGRILYQTATPYRETTKGIIPIFNPYDVFTVVRTIGEQMRDNLAPALNVEYKHVTKMKFADYFGDKVSSRISSKDLQYALPDILNQWISDGCPKAILTIPAGNSKKIAKEVEAFFKSHELPEKIAAIRGRKYPTILNAVGCTKIDKDRSLDGIREDKEANGRLFDLCIGCRKFDEGTDVPSASHIYMIGLPSSVRLFHQRTGRVLRHKSDVKGYAEWFGTEWVTHSKVVFFAPCEKTIKDISNQVARQLLHCILAGESYEAYYDKVQSTCQIRTVIKNKRKTVTDEARLLILDKIEDIMNAVEINNAMNFTNRETQLLNTLCLNGNINMIEGISNIIESDESDTTKLEKCLHLIDKTKGGLPSEAEESLVTDIINDEDNIESANDAIKKNKTIELAPFTKKMVDKLHACVDCFEDIEITTESTDSVSKVMMTITGENLNHWTEICKIGLTDEAYKDYIIDKYTEWKLLQSSSDARPSPSSSNPIERELSRVRKLAESEYQTKRKGLAKSTK